MTVLDHLTLNKIPLVTLVKFQVVMIRHIASKRLNLRGQELLKQHHHSPVMMTLLLSDCATISSRERTSQQWRGRGIARSVR
jgi:hypothetical protein